MCYQSLSMGKQAGNAPKQSSGKKELTKSIEAKITAAIREVTQDADGAGNIKKLVRKASKAISAKLWKKAKADDKTIVAAEATPQPLPKPAQPLKKVARKKAVKAAPASTSKKVAVKSAAKKAAVKRSKPSKPAGVKETSE